MKTSVNIQGTRHSLLKEVVDSFPRWKLSTDMHTAKVIWRDSDEFRPKHPRRQQKISQFPHISRICRKSNLLFSLERLKASFPKEFLFYPYTWFVPTQLHLLKDYMAQGHWVYAQQDGRRHSSFLTKALGSLDYREHFVVQKYIDNPCLLNGFAFDIRVYVLVTRCSPLKAYLFREGLVKFAGTPYEHPYDSPRQTIPLSGYAANKYGQSLFIQEDLVTATAGNKRTLSAVFGCLAAQGWNVSHVESQIKDIVIKTLCCLQPQISHHYQQVYSGERPKCFQLFAFNFVLDSVPNPWLTSVNPSPSLNCNTAVDFEVKRHLLVQTLRLLTQRHRRGTEMYQRLLPQREHAHYMNYLKAAEAAWAAYQGGPEPTMRLLPTLHTRVRTNIFHSPRRTRRQSIRKKSPRVTSLTPKAEELPAAAPDMLMYTSKRNEMNTTRPLTSQKFFFDSFQSSLNKSRLRTARHPLFA